LTQRKSDGRRGLETEMYKRRDVQEKRCTREEMYKRALGNLTKTKAKALETESS